MPNILVVDDDPNNQRVLSYTLRKAGFDARVAGDGQAALALLEEFPFDLVIADIAMPVMDGLTLLHRIHAEERFKHIPVVILTASGDDRERIIAEQEGAQGFLTKPASSRMVIETVQRLLGLA